MTRPRRCAYCRRSFDPTNLTIEYLVGVLHKAGGSKKRMALCPDCTALLMALTTGGI